MSFGLKARIALTLGMISLATAGCSAPDTHDAMKTSAQSIDNAAMSALDAAISEYSTLAQKTKKTVDSPEAIATANVARSDLSAQIDSCDEILKSAQGSKSTMTTLEINEKTGQINDCIVEVNKKSASMSKQISIFAKAREEAKAESEKNAKEEESKNYFRNELEDQFYSNIERNQNLSYERFRNAKKFQNEIDGSGSSTPSPTPTPQQTSESTPTPTSAPTTSSPATPTDTPSTWTPPTTSESTSSQTPPSDSDDI